MSNEKNLVVLGIRGIILHSCMGIVVNHDKDPSYTTSTMESKRVFFREPLAQARTRHGGGASQALGTLITSGAMPGSCFE